MATCAKCGDEYPDRRKELGFDTCLECGEEAAKWETERKRLRVGVAYNKGCYQFITSDKMVKDLGR